MAQRLIVEGNDAIALATLCKLRNLPPPAGYANREKFRNDFVQVAGGYQKALKILEETLKDTSIENVGIIVDANQTGVLDRWNALRQRLAIVFSQDDLNAVSLRPGGIVLRQEGLTFGTWIMPDNHSQGYFEHFLSSLIPTDSEVWQLAQTTVEALVAQPFCLFPEIKKQKALVHTWLAWQRSPGLPFGTAMQSSFFDASSPVVQPFLDWFSQTFVLE